jgi:pimeloyl-ACP methyl ester carboxylesterase
MDAMSGYEEFGVFVSLGDDRLCGVVCAPVGEMHDLGVVLLTGGNYTRSHRNRMWVRAARELASHGVPSIRFDYHGVGDSTGTATLQLEAPFDADAVAAGDFLRRATGVEQLAVVATCFGGRTAMAAAARDPHVVSATIFPVPLMIPDGSRRPGIRSFGRRSLRRWRWGRWLLKKPVVRHLRGQRDRHGSPKALTVSPRFKQDLGLFLRRGQVRFVYGELTDYLPGLRRCLDEVRPRFPEGAWTVDVQIIPGTDLHRFQTLKDQDLVVEATVASVARSVAETTEASA